MGGYVYMLASKKGGTIYIGVAADLSQRVYDHRQRINTKSFTARGSCPPVTHSRPRSSGKSKSPKRYMARSTVVAAMGQITARAWRFQAMAAECCQARPRSIDSSANPGIPAFSEKLMQRF